MYLDHHLPFVYIYVYVTMVCGRDVTVKFPCLHLDKNICTAFESVYVIYEKCHS